MTTLLLVTAAVVAIAAAARSTWSPCGVSMLATVTPLAERGRGHRYRTTVSWFVAGAVLGGATLGLVTALLALAVRAADLSPHVQALVGLAAAALAGASDLRLGGFSLPVHHRQVNERWLDGFRPWVYGIGFGWQIGTGLATYIMTAAVYLTVVLGALTGSLWAALAIGMVFGLVRGLAVLLGRHIDGPAALAEFHRRFTSWGPMVRALTVAIELGTTLVLSLALSSWVALAVAVAAGVMGGHRLRRYAPMSTALTRTGTSRTS